MNEEVKELFNEGIIEIDSSNNMENRGQESNTILPVETPKENGKEVPEDADVENIMEEIEPTELEEYEVI